MDDEIKKNVLKTGTTTLGIVCKDGVVVAADRRISFGTPDNQGVAYIAGKQEKIYPLNENSILTIAGGATDSERIIKIIRSELKLRELKSKSKPTMKQIAGLLSTMVYQTIRQPAVIPSITHFLLSGKDENGLYLYDIMPDGHLREVENYTVSGSGMMQANPILDSDYKEGLTLKEGVELAKKCLFASFGRDPASGAGMDIYTVSKEGIKQILKKEFHPDFKDQ